MHVIMVRNVPPYGVGERRYVSDDIGKQLLDQGHAEEFKLKAKPGPKPKADDKEVVAKKAKVAAKARTKRQAKKATAKEEAERTGAVKEG